MEIRLHTISYAGLGRKVTTLKRLLILSDSHRFLEPMVRAVEHVKPDYIFHLGDLSADAQQLAQRVMQIPVLSVTGNCDFLDRSQEQRMMELEGVKILLCHGHRYHVKSTLLPLYLAARENGVRLALFGHTHAALLEEKDGITLLNPGSCGPTMRPSCAVVELSGGEFTCRIEYFHDWSEDYDSSN